MLEESIKAVMNECRPQPEKLCVTINQSEISAFVNELPKIIKVIFDLTGGFVYRPLSMNDLQFKGLEQEKMIVFM